MGLFRFNLEVNYFLGNLLKFFSSLFFGGLFSFLPFVFCLFFVFFVGDFLGFLFLRGIFFVIYLFFVFVQILTINFSFLLYIFYSVIFSFLCFLVFFMLPYSLIFWLKTLLSIEFFFVVLLPILSYITFSFFKPSVSLLVQ